MANRDGGSGFITGFLLGAAACALMNLIFVILYIGVVSKCQN